MESESLSLEQEFDLRVFAEQVKQMSHEQAQEHLLKLYRAMMVRDSLFREILKHALDIGGEDWYSTVDPSSPFPG